MDMENENFEKIMRALELNPLSSQERVEFTSGLDKRLNRYQRRALSFYRMSFGFGTAMIALIAISIISIWSSFHQIENGAGEFITEVETMYDSYGYYDNALYDSASDTLGEGYVDLLVENYIDGFAEGSTEYLVGELTDEELLYLQENLDVGDIL